MEDMLWFDDTGESTSTLPFLTISKVDMISFVECHEASNKKSIDVAYIPYARVQDFLEGEKATYVLQWNGTSTRTCMHKKMSKTHNSTPPPAYLVCIT